MVNHQFSYYADTPFMGFFKEILEIAHLAVFGVYAVVVGNIVAVVPQRRRVKWQQPDGRNPEALQMRQPFNEAPEVAYAVAVAVAKRFHVQLVDDGVFVPLGVGGDLFL